jgi:lambda repressor-like predicted transcriptional regulator
VNPDRIAELAAMAREVARAARESGDTERALLLYARAEWLDDWAANERLRASRPTGTVNSAMMSDTHKVNMSRSRAVADRKFMEHIREKGYSLNALAKAAKMSPASLSQSRRKQSDPLFRRISAEKAKLVEKLTGWPASDWP